MAALLTLVGLVVAGGALPADAQTRGVGVGGRLSFIRGDAAVPDSTRRLIGGVLRARTSPRIALELALDYRSQETETEKITEYPFQGSVLVYPVRSALSIYLLGGIGWYSQSVAPLDAEGMALDGVTTRRFGSHAGLGGEIEFGERATLHLDYRFTFVGFGDDGPADQGGAVPIPGTIGLQERLKLSHEGSMWTTGLTFYF
jgi:hypothetical protein